MYIFMPYAIRVRTDILVTTFILATLYVYAHARKQDDPKKECNGHLLQSYNGVGFFAKQVIGLIPIGVIIIYESCCLDFR